MSDNKKIIPVIPRKKGEKRDETMMPAIVYGAKRESTPIFINKNDFAKLYKESGESTLITLDIKDSKDKPLTLIYDIQRDPLKGNIIHADFFEPDLKEEVEAEIPLVFFGEAPAIKELDGTLVKNMYSVDVKAVPQKLPHDIQVDIGELKTFDDVIQIKDLNVSSDVEILHDKEMTVVMIARPEDVDSELEKPLEDEEAEVITEKSKEDSESENEEGHQEQEKNK